MKNLPRPTAVSLLKAPAIVLLTVILCLFISPFTVAADSDTGWERSQEEMERIEDFVRQFITSAHDLDMEKLTEMTKPIEKWLAREWPAGSGRAFSKVYFEGWGRFPLIEIEKVEYLEHDDNRANCTLAFQVGQEVIQYYFQVERIGERLFVDEKGHFWPIRLIGADIFFDVRQTPDEQGVLKHVLAMETKGYYPTINFSIRFSCSLSGKTLMIDIFDVYNPPNGWNQSGPARGIREVNLADGDYELVFKLDEIVDKYALTVSGEKILVDGIGSARFTQRKVGVPIPPDYLLEKFMRRK